MKILGKLQFFGVARKVGFSEGRQKNRIFAKNREKTRKSKLSEKSKFLAFLRGSQNSLFHRSVRETQFLRKS
jgi:hypothetical protein